MKITATSKYYIAAFVACATFAVYLQSIQNEFILWDDDLYVYENPFIRSFGIDFFRWAFFDFHAGNWHPLTWISHALDYAVWGLNPLGHHLTNNILHALNTFVVVLLVVKLTDHPYPSLTKEGSFTPNSTPPILGGVSEGRGGKRSHDSQFALIAASVTGLLFGLHPLHVESVAWVSERKDLLCTLFFMLSVMMYVSYAGRGGPVWPLTEGQPQRLAPTQNDLGQPGMTRSGPQFLSRYYVLSLIFFILALMSKPMAVTLPIVLLILDWYPLGRMQSLKSVRAVFVEKVPFIALSLASAVLTVLAQRAGGTIRSIEFAPLSTRVLVGFKSLIMYLWKMVLPVELVPFYPYPGDAFILSIKYLSAIILVSGITIACIIMARRQKLWLSVWGYYVITLLPVLGIVQVGRQSMADRYTYLPSLGPFLVLGMTAAWVWTRTDAAGKRGRPAKYLAVAAAVFAVISLSYLTLKQTGIWRNSIVFWSYVIEKEPEKVPDAFNNRGSAFYKKGLPDKAIEDFDKAIALDPSYYEAYNNRGTVFLKLGLFDKAIADFDKTISINPGRAAPYVNRGKVYFLMGQYVRAEENFNKAISLSQNYAVAYLNRGTLFFLTGNIPLAISDFQKACELGNEEGCARLARVRG
jgi:hypothetical protein